MSYMETYREWCTNPYFSEETRAELEAIRDNEAEIEDRFYRQLESVSYTHLMEAV